VKGHALPPRSPDLNPLEFYLWGHVKSGLRREDELPQRATRFVAVDGATFTVHLSHEFNSLTSSRFINSCDSRGIRHLHIIMQ
jgi:hypothetical protein